MVFLGVVFATVNLAWAGEKIAILDGLAKDGVKVSLANDGQLNSVRAKGNYAYLNLSTPNVNNIYRFYDTRHNLLGTAVWHTVQGVALSGTSSGSPNISYYYDYATATQLFTIDKNTQRVNILESGKFLRWEGALYVGAYGNFGKFAGQDFIKQLAPINAPVDITVY